MSREVCGVRSFRKTKIILQLVDPGPFGLGASPPISQLPMFAIVSIMKSYVCEWRLISRDSGGELRLSLPNPSSTNLDTYDVNFQECSKHTSDHGLIPWDWRNVSTLRFQRWGISCHGFHQTQPAGRPTRELNNCRNVGCHFKGRVRIAYQYHSARPDREDEQAVSPTLLGV